MVPFKDVPRRASGFAVLLAVMAGTLQAASSATADAGAIRAQTANWSRV